MSHIFISYTRRVLRDQRLAEALRERLEAAGHTVFMDLAITAGEDWSERIEAELSRVDVFIALLSKTSVRRPMVKAEVRRIVDLRSKYNRKIVIVPVRVVFEGTLPFEMEGYLGELNYVVWNSAADTQRLLEEIRKSIRGKGSVTHSFPQVPPELTSSPQTSLEPIRWLHLSDMHLGCRGEALLWQTLEEFRRSLAETLPKLGGPPDLVLLTGDLTNQGKKKDFELVDRFLDQLFDWLREVEPSANPIALPVPGNHDVARPTEVSAYKYAVLDLYEQGEGNRGVKALCTQLWQKRKATLLKPLFRYYQAWFERRIRPELESRGKDLHVSHIPGDYVVEIEPRGSFRLSIVGLNSSWTQYQDDDYQGKISLPVEQFHAALCPDPEILPLKRLEGSRHSLLLMHHPPDWLSRISRKNYNEGIHTPNRFALCLHGHMHEGRSETLAISGGKARYFFQAPSLFGVEHYGTDREKRSIGYALGLIEASGEVRVWPFQRVRLGGGECEFKPDQSFTATEDDGSVQVRPPDKPSIDSGKVKSSEPSVDLGIDWTPYLSTLVNENDHIEIRGIGSRGGRMTDAAPRVPIEQLYTPLYSRGEMRRVNLTQLIPRHHKLFLEGQPGAGKTTFLQLVACMLVKDLLGEQPPEGKTWRSRYLGIEDREPPKIPIFLRMSHLTLLLAQSEKKRRADNCQWLLDQLESWCEDHEIEVPRDHWKQLLENGDAMLLLDGLDEVADENLRGRVFSIFRDALRNWSKCPVVVTSRPIERQALLEMGFAHAVIDPFGEAEIETFVNRWYAAVQGEKDPDLLPGGIRRDRDTLQKTLRERPRIRQMAENPVMLTCLCVVHWNEGGLPEARSRLYRAVVLWLLKARGAQRREKGFTDEFAERALARLALAMMRTDQGKRALFGLEEAAEVVLPEVRREYPKSTKDALQIARDWLGFESLCSGIIEELAGRRLRFWHLTFQEFLAALQLAWKGDGANPNKDFWPVLKDRLDDAQWRETIELLPGCLHDQGGIVRIDRLLERIVMLRGDSPDLATDARIAGILSRLLEPLAAFKYPLPESIRQSYDQVLKRSLGIFSREGAGEVPVEIRIAAAEALGQGGDPRIREDQDNFLKVTGLYGVRIGKYPVTVEEFQRFVEARGYDEVRYWDEVGWRLREERKWKSPHEWEKQLLTPNRPVIYVSWFEAMAYCRWLSDLRKPELVRLPTEFEWQMAATSKNGPYPWGNVEPGQDHANYDERVGAPTPVGIYPSGDGPYGHCDLAGNVWEWCLESWSDVMRERSATEIAKIMRQARQTEDATIWRGGCWFNGPGKLLSSCRFDFWAVDRSVYVGFRVLISSLSVGA